MTTTEAVTQWSAAGEDSYGRWAEIQIEDATMRFRWIPPGRFVMGSSEGEIGAFDNEGPRHKVCITRGYWMMDVPVTDELWLAVTGQPVESALAGHPTFAAWDDWAVDFLVALNRRLPWLSARFPTEAEWEFACRASTTTATWAGDLEDEDEENDSQFSILYDIAWYTGNGDGRTHPVRSNQANPHGLYDMLGAPYEWCLDLYGSYPKGHATDPTGPKTGDTRVLRGCAFDSEADEVRAANRTDANPSEEHALRIVCTLIDALRPEVTMQKSMPNQPPEPTPEALAQQRVVINGRRDFSGDPCCADVNPYNGFQCDRAPHPRGTAHWTFTSNSSRIEWDDGTAPSAATAAPVTTHPAAAHAAHTTINATAHVAPAMPTITHKDLPMPNTPSNPLLATLQTDATDAAWRTAGSQFVKLAREPLVGLLSRHLGPDDEALRGRIAAFLETEIGTALLSAVLSAGLMAVPVSAGDVPQRLARELRVRAMTDAGDVIADVLMGPLRTVAALYLQGTAAVATMPAELPEPAAAVMGASGVGEKVAVRG